MKAWLTSTVTGVLTSAALRNARRGLAGLRRRLRGTPLEVHYFHQVDDPYSQLAAGFLARFCEAYAVELIPHLVGAPPDEAAPERAKLERFARKDAADIAPAYGTTFAGGDFVPSPEAVSLANCILAAQDAAGFVDVAADVGRALWSHDQIRMRELAESKGMSTVGEAREAVAQGTALRDRMGHYLSAMFYCDPEWYWGVDRLGYLERRLSEMGRATGKIPTPVAVRRDLTAMPENPPERRLQLEFFLSLRSPYTAIAMRRVFALPDRYPVDVVLKPVLPMVMRGLPVPAAKRMYIVFDTKREAESAGVPFGRVCDPVGKPVERGFALYAWARDCGRAQQYLQSFAEGVFADGIDAGSEEGLRKIVERAGLSWADAQAHRDDQEWRRELERNREELFGLGLWGVPSFRLIGSDAGPDFCTWGQDRIWLVEQEIRRRLT
jgi:2-hydroxychromene-2-carboxylate isomerase